MNKWQRLLTGLLVAQLALIVFVFWPRPAVSSGGQSLLADLTVDQITGLAITDEQGSVTRLAKQGDSWIAPEAGAYPADAAKITTVLDKLLALETGRLIAQTPQSHAQLQVADDKFARKIELTKADGATQTLFLGSPAGGQSVHARLGGQNEVYLGSGLATWEVDASLLSWINPVYLNLNASDVAGLTLRNQNGEFILTKDAQAAWQMEGLESGEKLDQAKVTTLINALASIRMTEPLGKTEDPAWGMASPNAVATIQVKSGDQVRPVTLTVGAQDPDDKSYVVKSSDSEYYVRVAEFSLQDIVERDRAGFLSAPAAPPASPTPAP